MRTARPLEVLPRPALGLVVVPPDELAALITTAVGAALDGTTSSGPLPLMDRVGISRTLHVSVSTVDRLVRQGMPHVMVAEARRFEPGEVLAWLRNRGNNGPH